MAPGDNIFLNLESLLEFRQKIMDGKYPNLKRRALMMAMLDERIDELQKEVMEVMGYYEDITALRNEIVTVKRKGADRMIKIDPRTKKGKNELQLFAKDDRFEITRENEYVFNKNKPSPPEPPKDRVITEGKTPPKPNPKPNR